MLVVIIVVRLVVVVIVLLGVFILVDRRRLKARPFSPCLFIVIEKGRHLVRLSTDIVGVISSLTCICHYGGRIGSYYRRLSANNIATVACLERFRKTLIVLIHFLKILIPI